MTNPHNDPATDPIATVRVDPNADPNDPKALRYVKVNATSYAPYNGQGWIVLTQGRSDDGGNTWANGEMPADWPVQPLAEVARILGHPEPNPDRCISCEHSLSSYHHPDGCGYQVGTARQNRSETCTCGRGYRPAPVPVEDTDTPDSVTEVVDPIRDLVGNDKADEIKTALRRAMNKNTDTLNGARYVALALYTNLDKTPATELIGLYDTPTEAWEGARTVAGPSAVFRLAELEPPNCCPGPAKCHRHAPAAPSTVDSSARERIKNVVYYHDTTETDDELTNRLLAALPELADRENERLHSEIDRLTYRGDRLEAELNQLCAKYNTAVHQLDDLATTRTTLRQRNRDYGRASATIGQLRGDIARLKGYRHSVRQFIADQRKLDATITELGYEGRGIHNLLDKLTNEIRAARTIHKRVWYTSPEQDDRWACSCSLNKFGRPISWPCNTAAALGATDIGYPEPALPADDNTRNTT